MANPLLAVMYKDMAMVSGEYFKYVKQEIWSLPQSFSAFESTTLLFHPWKLRPYTWPYNRISPINRFPQPCLITLILFQTMHRPKSLNSFYTGQLKTIFQG